MSYTTERRLLAKIHQHARIEKACTECLHQGDFTVCAFCEKDPEHKRWEWRFEEEYCRMLAQVEEIFEERPQRRRKKCRIQK